MIFNDDDGAVGGVVAVPRAERDPVREVVEYYGKCILILLLINISQLLFVFSDLTEEMHEELDRVVAAMRQRVMEDRLNAALQNAGVDPDDITNQFNTTLQLTLDDLLDF